MHTRPPCRSVLVVDDDPHARRLIVRALVAAGCSVTAVDDGEAAILEVVAHTYDVVVIDYRMPRMGGLETGHAIRHLCGDACGIIGMTASENCREDFFRAGANAFFEKPLSREMLAELVRVVSEGPVHRLEATAGYQ